MKTDSAPGLIGGFPAGLRQPAGSFRFSTDALLLAGFAAQSLEENAGGSLLDMGCGCGVVAFGVLLLRKNLRAVGVDMQQPLLDAAVDNAEGLGLASRFATLHLDMEDAADRQRLACGTFHLVVANPPYHDLGAGRPPSDEARRLALFARPGTLPCFLATARHALAPGGGLALIYPAQREDTLTAALADQNFYPEAVLPVRGRESQRPSRVLMLARQGYPGAPGEVRRAPTLALFRGNTAAYTPEALRLCPFLSRNL